LTVVGVGRDRLDAGRPQPVHAQLPGANLLRQCATARADAVRRGLVEPGPGHEFSRASKPSVTGRGAARSTATPGNFPGYTQFAAATRNGKRAVTTSLNIPAPTGALLQRLRAVQTTAVCALLRK
jgi:hypothetical protein